MKAVQDHHPATASGAEASAASALRRLDICFGAGGFLLALLISVAHRYTMNADALSYLEAGERWWKGDFSHALNGYWSPLYPILIAAIAKLGSNGVSEIFPIHIFQAFIFSGAYFAFRWLVGEMEQAAGTVRNLSARLAFRAAAFSIFLWSSFCLIDLGELFPDLLMSVWMLLAAGFLLRIKRKGWRAALGFGVMLGLGYLTKPVGFPLGIVFLFCSLVILRRSPGNFAVAMVSFLLVSAIYIVPLSLQKHRFTFSESGKLAYAWEVNGISPYFHWQGEPPGTGRPLHPTKEILEFPPTFAFETDRPGTYPLWLDASYWNEGLHPTPNVRDQLRRLAISARFFADLMTRQPVPVILLFSLIMAGLTVGWRRMFEVCRPFVPLLLVSLAAGVLYSLVFVLSRYLAPFAVFLIVSLMAASIRVLEDSGINTARWLQALTGIAVAWVLGTSAISVGRGFFGTKTTSYKVQEKVAEEVEQLGVGSGGKVAVIGRGCDAFFARILGATVVAEAPILGGHPVWPATFENLERIAVAMRKDSTAQAVVSDVAPAGQGNSGPWKNVPGTTYWVRPLKNRSTAGE